MLSSVYRIQTQPALWVRIVSVIEFTFNYPEIGYLRIENWLESAWYNLAQENYWLAAHPSLMDKARSHNYEN